MNKILLIMLLTQNSRPVDLSGCAYTDGWHPDDEQGCATVVFTVDNRVSSQPIILQDNGRTIVTVPDQPRASDGAQRYVEIALVSGKTIVVDREQDASCTSPLGQADGK